MQVRQGVSWGAPRRRRHVGLVAGLVLAIGMIAPIVHAEDAPATSEPGTAEAAVERVIVRIAPGFDATSVVEAHGGSVHEVLPALGSVVADVPGDQLDALAGAPGVIEVAPDTGLQVVESDPEDAPSSADLADGRGNPMHFVPGDFDKADRGSSFDSLTVDEVARIVGADKAHERGATGQGVDIAVIDTGIAPLLDPADVVNGPDLSFDSQFEDVRHLDTNGHGTYIAGIISGLAPDSRLVNVKVGATNGAVDVSQVLAAIDWVIQHGDDDGLNIRVLNLSYGTQNLQDYEIDPLAYAAEVAWRHGIVVVAAAGNAGDQFDRLTNPAIDPRILAVGASEAHGTYSTADDTVAAFSSRSSGRDVDLVAPGRSVVSLRTPGSYVDEKHPEGVVDATSFRGSGTSQSAAVTSAAAALLLDEHPGLTPDMVKEALTTTAKTLPNADGGQGAGILAVDKALQRAPVVKDYDQAYPLATGTGTLEGARGTSHVEKDGVVLEGEIDIHGTSWSGTSWSGTSWSGTSWSGGEWNGTSWSGTSWSGTSWSGTSWSGTSWSGTSWSGTSWSGTSWSSTPGWNGTSWSGTSWSGTSWSGTSWSGTSWSGTSWSGTSWSGTSWSGTSWSGTSWSSAEAA